MATFSWSDAFHAALDPCLSCIRTPPASHSSEHQQQRRYSDLERLLANDSTTSLTNDADALSLHSNIGRGPRRKKSVFPKSITLFGYHLFGRPPIQLPIDSSDALEPSRPHPPLDATIPDAAPLDAEAIQARAVEEAERAERKKRRRERREAKRAQLALAIQGGEGDFEGFQGSGPALSPFSEGTSSASGSTQPRVVTSPPTEHYMDHDEEGDGDFDAGAYSRRAPRGSSVGGSDSRSSLSASQPYNHQAMPHSPLSPHHDPSTTPRPKKHKKSKSSRTGSSKKSGSSAASYSVPSPSADGFPHHDPAVVSEGQTFEGFPDDLQELPTAHAIATFPDAQGQMPSPGLSAGAGTFPSTGLGGRRSGKSDLGAFLASR